MAARNASNRYLKCRNGMWQYTRRIPKRYQNIDKRGVIRVSLKTDSLSLARSKRDALAEADEQYWLNLASEKGSITSLLDDEGGKIFKYYEAARHRALRKGFIYTPANELAVSADLESLVKRLVLVADNPKKEKRQAEALLGGVEQPRIHISQAFNIYCEKIAIGELLGKSPAQKKSWRKVKLRALNNFIKVCGDLPMDRIERKHGQAFYDWWGKRLIPSKQGKALSPNSANRDLGNIRKLYREYWKYQGEDTRDNPFRNLNYSKSFIKDVPHFDDEWVKQKILFPHQFDGLNPQAQLLVYALIETGCRPSELANLIQDNIILDHDVPHIQIKPKPDRQLKSASSIRDIPLVGVSLIAMRKAYKGFPHYKDKGNLLSASLMKAFKTRGLFPTPDHRIYSFRHSFEKRMLEAGIDYGLRCLLMGHKNNRPSYGDGGSLEYRRDELLKIAHPVPPGFFDKLPDPY